ERRDRVILTNVLVEPVDRPITSHLGLTEPHARLPPVRIVGRGLPVVDVVAEQAQRLVQHHVGYGGGDGRTRLVEAAEIARDRRERRRLLRSEERRVGNEGG